jgi:hypothetical protein
VKLTSRTAVNAPVGVSNVLVARSTTIIAGSRQLTQCGARWSGLGTVPAMIAHAPGDHRTPARGPSAAVTKAASRQRRRGSIRRRRR